MGLYDRKYTRDNGDYGEGGGFRRAWRRIFGEGDDVMSWAFPLFSVAGIVVRIHIFYLVFLAARLIWPLQPGSTGLLYTAAFLGMGFVFVLMHEFGHCLACRHVGGEANQIIMWPLGGLAACIPPRNWKANLITTIWGPLTNLLLAGVLAGAMIALGASWRTALFNPFYPWHAYIDDPWFRFPTAPIWKLFLFSAFQANAYLFIFNVFLPMYPMDGGRILQEILWSRIGYRRATRIAANVGLVLAILVGGFAAMTGQNILFSICFFCGFTCWRERQMLAFIEDEPDWASGETFAEGGYVTPRAKRSQQSAADKAYQAALKRQEKERAMQAEVDRILDKIREQGMQSLTGREKATLKDATDRGRGGG